MKKSLKKVMLFGAMLLALGASFVGCKDYDDDIDNLNNEINQLKSELTTAKSDLATVKTNAETALTTANAAKTAADAAAASAITTEEVEKAAKDAADAAAAAAVEEAKLNTIEYVDAEIAKALSGIGNGDGLTTEEVEEMIKPIAADLQALGVTLASVQATQGQQNLAILKLQAKVMEAYGADVTELNAIIEALEEDSTTAVDWDKVSELVASINPNLDITGGLTLLKNLIFMPDAYINGIPAISYYRIFVNNLNLLANTDVQVRMNPYNANVDEAEWQFWNRAVTVKTRATGDENDNFISIIPNGIKYTERGSAIFTTQANYAAATTESGKENFVVVEATLPNADGSTYVVTSDEVMVDLNTINNVAIMNEKTATATPAVNAYEYVYPTSEAAVTTNAYPVHHTVPSTFSSGANYTFDLMDYVYAAADLEDVYANYMVLNSGFTVDNTLSTGISGTAPNQHISGVDFQNLDDLNFTDYSWRFESVSYTASDNTDQSYFVDLSGSKVTVNSTVSSIGRRPVFRATLLNAAGNTVVSHYVKFEITATPIEKIPALVVDLGDINYVDLYAIAPNTVPVFEGPSWQDMNDKIYQKLGLTHPQFVGQYNVTALNFEYEYPVATTNDVNGNRPDLASYFASHFAPTQTSTAAIEFSIDPQTRFGKHDWTVNFEPNDPTLYPTVQVVFTFNLVKPKHPKFEVAYVGSLSEPRAIVRGQAASGIFQFETTISESFEVTDLARFDSEVVQHIANAGGIQTQIMAYEFSSAYGGATPAYDGTPSNDNRAYAVNSGRIDAIADPVADYLTQQITLATPIDQPYWDYDVVFRSEYENQGIVETPWEFRFYNPLKVSLTGFTMATPMDGSATVDALAKHLTVTVLDAPIITTGTVNASNATLYSVPSTIAALPWAIDYKGSTVALPSKLYLGNSATASTPASGPSDYVSLVWYNEGQALQIPNTDTEMTVTIETPYAIATGTAGITLEKTPNP